MGATTSSSVRQPGKPVSSRPAADPIHVLQSRCTYVSEFQQNVSYLRLDSRFKSERYLSMMGIFFTVP